MYSYITQHVGYLLHHGTEKSVDTRLIRKTQSCPKVADVQGYGKAVQRPEVETQSTETEVKGYGKAVQRPEVETQSTETEVKGYGKAVQRPEVETQSTETETQVAVSSSHNVLTPGLPDRDWN